MDFRLDLIDLVFDLKYVNVFVWPSLVFRIDECLLCVSSDGLWLPTS